MIDLICCKKTLLFHSLWRFASKRYDLETGLLFFEKRYYISHAGRFLTPDPLEFEDGPNLYTYVHHTPLLLIDPYGLEAEGITDNSTNSQNASDQRGNIFTRFCRWAWDGAGQTLSSQRTQGAFQAIGGLTEAGSGVALIGISGGVATPVGGALFAHGIDNYTTGMHRLFNNEYEDTTTVQVLQYTGLSHAHAHLVDTGLNIAGSLGIMAAASIKQQQYLTSSMMKVPERSIIGTEEKIREVTEFPNIISNKYAGVTPEKYFGSKTYSQLEAIFTHKFSPPRPGAPGGKSFFNPKTGRTFHLHQYPGHMQGRPHVDIRRRGPYQERKYLLQEE